MEETVIDSVISLSEEEFVVCLGNADSYTEEVTETEVIEGIEENND